MHGNYNLSLKHAWSISDVSVFQITGLFLTEIQIGLVLALFGGLSWCAGDIIGSGIGACAACREEAPGLNEINLLKLSSRGQPSIRRRLLCCDGGALSPSASGALERKGGM